MRVKSKLNTCQMADELYILDSGVNFDLYILGSVAVREEFKVFLSALSTKQRAQFQSCFHRVMNLSAQNSEIFGYLKSCVGLHSIVIGGFHAVYFRAGRKLVLCSFGLGKVSQESTTTAQLCHSRYLVAQQKQLTNTVNE